MPVLSKADKQRLSLLRMAKGNPQAIMVVLDEIKREAKEALRSTLSEAEPSVLKELDTRVNQVFNRLYMEADKMFKEQEQTFLSKLDTMLRAEVAKIEPPKGDKGDSPTNAELLALIRPLIPRVRDGHTPTTDKLRAVMKPLVDTAIANAQPDERQKAEQEKRLEEKIVGVANKLFGEHLSKIKRFSGGGATGPNPTPIKNITVNGTGERKLTGSINGSNTVFTVTRPFRKGQESVYQNGIRLQEGSSNDYTVNDLGRTITFNTAPLSDDIIVIDINAGI